MRGSDKISWRFVSAFAQTSDRATATPELSPPPSTGLELESHSERRKKERPSSSPSSESDRWLRRLQKARARGLSTRLLTTSNNAAERTQRRILFPVLPSKEDHFPEKRRQLLRIKSGKSSTTIQDIIREIINNQHDCKKGYQSPT